MKIIFISMCMGLITMSCINLVSNKSHINLVSNKSQDKVIVYPAAEGSPVSTDYIVTVARKDVPVYTAGVETRGKANQNHPYYFCYFDLSGEATITVSSKEFSLENAILVPNHEKIKYKTGSDGSLKFTVKGPTKITVMPKGYD
ncbi:MAG: hypothetical protein ACUVTX_12115, partial [Bacteroidales bacterium]